MINGHIDSGYIISAVLVAAAVTFVLRVLPFGLKKPSRVLRCWMRSATGFHLGP